ncbi:MAG TPA: HAMP domain-containing protein, partial [Phenylobacterium sp.]
MSQQASRLTDQDFQRRVEFTGLKEQARVRMASLAPVIEPILADIMDSLGSSLGSGEREVYLRHWRALAATTLEERFPREARELGERNFERGLPAGVYMEMHGVILARIVGHLLETNWTKKWHRGGFGGESNIRDRTLDAVSALIKTALLDLQIGLEAYAQNLAPASPAAPAATEAPSSAEFDAMLPQLRQAMAHLARGDLTYRLQVKAGGELGELAAGFNAAADQLDATTAGMAVNAGVIDAEARKIQQLTSFVAERIQQRAVKLAETAAALEAITVNVQRTSDGANKAEDAAVAAGR